MFPMTITIHNSSQLAGVLAAMAADDPAVTKAALLAGVQAQAQDTSTFKHPSEEAAQSPADWPFPGDDKQFKHSPEAEPEGKPQGTAAAKPAPRARTKPSAEAPADAAPESSGEASPGDAPQAEPVTYDQVKPLILQLVRVDRAKAVDILGGFGVKVGTDLKPEQYADAKAQLEAALAA